MGRYSHSNLRRDGPEGDNIMTQYKYATVYYNLRHSHVERERASQLVNDLGLQGYRVIDVATTQHYICWTLERLTQPTTSATPYHGGVTHAHYRHHIDCRYRACSQT